MGYLHGKNVLVTGSSRGIGRAIAQRLAREGAAVGVTYAGNAEKARQVVGEIEAGGGRAFATQADMRDLGQVRAMFDAAAERLGPLDVFVHNAAGVNVFKPTADMTVDDYDSMFLITRGCYFALQEAARRLRDGGRVVCVSSVATVMPIPTGGAYAGSKAAIEQFCAGLAKELGPRGITVNVVRPGLTRTDGMVLSDDQAAHMVAQTPLGRLGEPPDVAGAVAMLLSDDARWVSGQCVGASGGIG